MDRIIFFFDFHCLIAILLAAHGAVIDTSNLTKTLSRLIVTKFSHLTITLLTAGFLAGGTVEIPAQSAGATQQEKAYEPFEESMPWSEVDSSMLGQEIAFHGEIDRFIPSPASNVPSMMYFSGDGEQNIMAVYWQDVNDAIYAGMGDPEAGVQASVRGRLSDYRGSLQIKVSDASQIRIEGYPHLMSLEAKPASNPAQAWKVDAESNPPAVIVETGDDGYYTTSQLGDLLENMMQRTISIKGEVTNFRPFWSPTAPNIITLGEGDESIEVVYWSQEPADYSKVGSFIYLTGRLQQYQGRNQIKVGNLRAISTEPLAENLVAKPTAMAARPEGPAKNWPGFQKAMPEPIQKQILSQYSKVSIRELSPAHAGNTILVEGVVEETIPGAADEDLLRIKGDDAYLTVRAPKGAAQRLKPGAQIVVRGKLEYSDMRSKPELRMTDKEFVLSESI